MSKKALIIIRHGNDIPKNVSFLKNPNPDYKLPDGSIVTISKTRLTKHDNDYGKPAGEDQAKNLGNYLASWMKGKYSDIGRVLTQNPKNGDPSSTPNPFCTIYPVINPEEKGVSVTAKPVSVDLYMDENTGEKPFLKDLKIFDEGDYSTLLCATRQTIWGRKHEDDHDNFIHDYPDAGTFMDRIADKENTSGWEHLKDQPSKCKSIYVFTDFDNSIQKFKTLEKFNLNESGIN